MAKVKFYLDKRPRKNSKKQPLYLVFRHQGKEFFFFPHIKVEPNYWDSKKERLKKNCKDATIINGVLDILEDKLYNIERNLRLLALLNGH